MIGFCCAPHLAGYMYVFGVVHSGIMFDIVRGLALRLTPQDIELLLTVLKHTGTGIRSVGLLPILRVGCVY